MPQYTPPTSPPWSPTTKLLVGFSLMALLFVLVGQLKSLIVPLLLAFILIFMLRPVVNLLVRVSGLGWRMCVGLLYLLFLILIALGVVQLGSTVINQIIDLFVLSESVLEDMPARLAELPETLPQAFPFLDRFPLLDIDPGQFAEQLLGVIQPVLGQAGDIIRLVAGTTASGLGWGFFIVLLSFFILLDMEPGSSTNVIGWVPGPYQADLQRLIRRISHLWRGFLYGQGLLVLLTVILSAILLTVLGVRNALALAVLAGVARFVPYAGPAIVWTLSAIVAFFQAENYLGLSPVPFTLLVVGAEIVLDQLFDNVISPRLLGQVLGVHPAAVLVAAIASLTLLGPVGLLLAAPLLATLLVLGRYILDKLFDINPPAYDSREEAEEAPAGSVLDSEIGEVTSTPKNAS